MIAFVRIMLRLMGDMSVLVLLAFKSKSSIKVENLILRRQLGLYKERGGIKPQRIDTMARVSLVMLSRLGRPPIPFEIRKLIRHLAR